MTHGYGLFDRQGDDHIVRFVARSLPIWKLPYPSVSLRGFDVSKCLKMSCIFFCFQPNSSSLRCSTQLVMQYFLDESSHHKASTRRDSHLLGMLGTSSSNTSIQLGHLWAKLRLLLLTESD